jgi:hypothetical protein
MVKLVLMHSDVFAHDFLLFSLEMYVILAVVEMVSFELVL